MEIVNKKYLELTMMLEDAMYSMDPRIRLNTRLDAYVPKDPISHSIYIQKFGQAVIVRSLAFHLSSKVIFFLIEGLQYPKIQPRKGKRKKTENSFTYF